MNFKITILFPSLIGCLLWTLGPLSHRHPRPLHAAASRPQLFSFIPFFLFSPLPSHRSSPLPLSSSFSLMFVSPPPPLPHSLLQIPLSYPLSPS